MKHSEKEYRSGPTRAPGVLSHRGFKGGIVIGPQSTEE